MPEKAMSKAEFLAALRVFERYGEEPSRYACKVYGNDYAMILWSPEDGVEVVHEGGLLRLRDVNLSDAPARCDPMTPTNFRSIFEVFEKIELPLNSRAD